VALANDRGPSLETTRIPPQHRRLSFVRHHKLSLRRPSSGLPHLSSTNGFGLSNITKRKQKANSSFRIAIHLQFNLGCQRCNPFDPCINKLLPLPLPFSRARRFIDKATVTFLRALDATATPTYARNPHVLDSANLAELWGLRQTARNSAIRSTPFSPACLALLSVNMPAKKRKMDAAEQKYYAVRAGFKPGVYTSWTICQQQITGFKGAQCMLPAVSFRQLTC
jgi:hypothetical protein